MWTAIYDVGRFYFKAEILCCCEPEQTTNITLVNLQVIKDSRCVCVCVYEYDQCLGSAVVWVTVLKETYVHKLHGAGQSNYGKSSLTYNGMC